MTAQNYGTPKSTRVEKRVTSVDTRACGAEPGLQHGTCVPRSELGRMYLAHAVTFRKMLRGKFLPARRAGPLHADDIDDAVQTAFVRILERDLPVRGELAAYLFATARNLCVSTLRDRRHLDAQVQSLQLVEAGRFTDSIDDGLELQAVGIVMDYVAALPPDLSALFRARYVACLSQRESAERLGMTRRHVRTLERRLLVGLARRLACTSRCR
jgi:RNA polymerase sigma factor (sigma-70 family)